MNKATLLCLLTLGLGLATVSQAQNATKKDEKAIKAVINQFFEAMQKGDTTLLRSTCTTEPILQSFMADREGKLQVMSEDFTDFVRFVGGPSQDKYREDIEFEAVMSEQSLASVWTPYKFYLNGKLHHCGTNSFQLVKTAEGWKIQYIIDTRRKGCKE